MTMAITVAGAQLLIQFHITITNVGMMLV